MLYGGPLGTYLSGLSSSGAGSTGSTYNSSSNPTSYLGSGIRRSNSRYRTSGVTSNSTLTPSTSSSSTTAISLSNYYTPQLRRKYTNSEAESLPTTGRYTSRTPSRTSTSPSTSNTCSPTPSTSGVHSGLFHYSRWSPSKSSGTSSYGTSSIGTSASWNADLNTVTSGFGINTDYKRLYEAEKLATDELRNEIAAGQNETKELQDKIEAARQSRSSSGANQRKIERRISECEEELKTLEKLRAESEKLRAEHRALVRVVARLNREK